MDNIDEKMGRERPFDEQQLIKREKKTFQEEKKELQRLVTELQHKVSQLEERLAEKEEQMSRIVKRRKMRTVAHVETLALLSSTKADLRESYQRCAALEQKLVEESEDSHQSLECGDHFRGRAPPEQDVEASKREEALKLQLLEKEQQMEELMRQRLVAIKEDFQKKLLEEREQNQQEQSQREERLRRQLEEKDESFKKQLSMLCEHWESRVQHWNKHRLELQEKLQEQENLQKQQEEESKQETEHLREEIQQLQVSSHGLPFSLLWFPQAEEAQCLHVKTSLSLSSRFPTLRGRRRTKPSGGGSRNCGKSEVGPPTIDTFLASSSTLPLPIWLLPLQLYCSNISLFNLDLYIKKTLQWLPFCVHH